MSMIAGTLRVPGYPQTSCLQFEDPLSWAQTAYLYVDMLRDEVLYSKLADRRIYVAVFFGASERLTHSLVASGAQSCFRYMLGTLEQLVLAHLLASVDAQTTAARAAGLATDRSNLN